MNNFIAHILKKHISPSILLISSSSVSGGCINSTFKVLTDQGPFFLKWNSGDLKEMFHSEQLGLETLSEYSPLKSPQPYGHGTLENRSYLLTEWIEKGTQSANFWQNFGNNLAKQHQVSHSHFGLNHDNFIGSLPQSNTKHTDWIDFFVCERLQPQLKLAEAKALVSHELHTQFDVLFSKLDQLVPMEKPALLHGDLWSGNFMTDQSGDAAIFDPAVHYGHRETELAFTKLFGGFSETFYDQYNESYPLEVDFDERVDIHNLYPLLVHVNLFGASYLSGIVKTLKQFT